LQKICKNVRALFHYKIQYSAVQIINIVNPILKGWCVYFSLGQSYIYRRKLEYYLHRLVWNWARRKHPRWGKNKIASQYFLNFSNDNIGFSKRKKKWSFSGVYLVDSFLGRFKNKKKNVHLFLPTKDISSLDPRCCYISIKLLSIHAFHFNIKRVKKFLKQQRHSIYKDFLLENK
jgi:RNA-directed DNA polymerase